MKMFTNHKENKKHKSTILILFLLIALGMGYAFLQTTLSINGSTRLDRQTWNVYWTAVSDHSTSSGAEEWLPPNVGSGATSVDFEIHLVKPGDSYEFMIYAYNGGSLDAMVDTINIGATGYESLPSYLECDLSYYDYKPIQQYDLLKAGSTEIYRVSVHYKKDITTNDLPTMNTRLVLTVGVTYIQADSRAHSASHTAISPLGDGEYFNYSSTYLYVNQTIANNMLFYTTPFAAIDAFEAPMFIRHDVENNKLVKSSLGFWYQGKLLYLYSGDGAYEINRAMLLENVDGTDPEMECSDVHAVGSGVVGYVCWGSEFVISIKEDDSSAIEYGNGSRICYLYNTYSYCD